MTVSVTTMTLFDVFFGIVSLWITFIFFKLGFSNKGSINYETKKGSIDNYWLVNQKPFTLAIFAGISLVSSIVAVIFYTGQTPLSVIQSLLYGNSLYIEYQLHFSLNNIAVFSLKKVPFILMLLAVKFNLIFSLVSFNLKKDRINLYEKLYLFAVIFSHIYIGIARGTSFEFFELLILIFFIMAVKNLSNLLSIKNNLVTILTAVLMSIVFFLGLSSRGVKFNHRISGDIYFDSTGIISSLSSFLSLVILMFFDYFGFGFFYMTTYYSKVWVSSINNFIGGFIPFGTQLLTKSTISSQMASTIDMGVRWHPDAINIIDAWGIIGLLLFCYIIGRLARIMQNQIEISHNVDIAYMTLYFILLQMISLPIGNFIQVSSSNKLIVAFLLFFWVWKFSKLSTLVSYIVARFKAR